MKWLHLLSASRACMQVTRPVVWLLMFSACLVLIAVGRVAVAEQADEPQAWTFDVADGGQQTGRLASLTPAEVGFVTSDGEVRVPAVSIRALEPVVKPAASTASARIWLTDGSVLAGDNLLLEGRELSLEHAGTTLRVPQQAVSKLAWTLEGEPPPASRTAAAAWQSVIPASAESDLIVIRKAADPTPVYQAVPCAILSIDAEHVTVALDDDRIPVKRERVAGLVWLRADEDLDLQGPVVDLVGGRVHAREVRYLLEADSFEMTTAWSQSLVVPAAAVRRIDLAAGRTVSLASLAPEDMQVTPFFAGLAAVDELAVAFEPRLVPAGESGPGGQSGPAIVVMPRTILRWKMPSGVRQLRLTAMAERVPAGGADVVVVVDGRELLRRRLTRDTEAGESVDVDVSGGRRLEVRVDFPETATGGLSGLGHVVLIDPRLEK